MDSGPGISLFQGGEDLQLNSSLQQQQEEEEAIEDERRRNEEIKNLLTTAFDDLSMDDDDDDEDDDRTTLDSTFHSNGGESNKSSLHENQVNAYNILRSLNSDNTADNNIITSNRTYDSSVVLKENKEHPQIRSILKNTISFNDSSSSRNDSLHTQNNSLKKQRNPYTLPCGTDSVREESVKQAGSGEGNEKRSPSPHYLHCYRRTSVDGKSVTRENISLTNCNQMNTEKGQREAYIATRYNSVEQLQLLYEVRLKEIESLKDLLEEEQKNSIALKDDLTRKMMLAEADKEGAILSYRQTSELLGWSKGKISDLEREVVTLKQNIVNLEKSQRENVKELETARGMVTELQQRLAFLERSDGTKQTERQLENTIKSLQNKHLQEITQLNCQLDTNNLKLKQKDEEMKALEERLLDLQAKLGSLMVEKTEAVSALIRDLEDSQNQCRQLMGSNVSSDNIRLQQKLEDLVKEKQENNHTIISLKTECEMLRKDLEQLESISRLGLSPVGESDSMVQLGLTSKNGSSSNSMTQHRCDSNLYLSDTNNKLKDELHRALLGQRAKRSEIKRLQEKLDRRENQISEMKKQERLYLFEVETLKDDMGKLMAELKSRRNDNGKSPKADAHTQTSKDFIETELENERKRINEIENEKEKLKRQLMQTEDLLQEAKDKLSLTDCENIKNDIKDDTLKALKKQLQNTEIEYSVKLEQKNKECDELKELYIQLRASKDAVSRQLDSEKDINHNINTQIKSLTDQVNDYQNKVKMKDELLFRYKSDKERLETELNQLKNNDSISSVTAEKEKECKRLKEELASVNKAYSTELDKLRNELQLAKDRVMQIEKNLRAEFTNKINKNQTEINSLRTTVQEKESQLIEMTNKLNIVNNIIKEDKNIMTEGSYNNELEINRFKENEQKLLQLLENNCQELKLCKEEATKKIALIEQLHKESLNTIVDKTREEIKKNEEKHNQIVESLKKQLNEQEKSLKAKYIADLELAEEEVKNITVKYFADEIKKIENRHRNELQAIARQVNASSPVANLQKLVAEKNKEIEKLKAFKPKYFEAEEKLIALERQIDSDRNATAELMTRWAREVQDVHTQMVNKQAKMDEMKEKLKKVKKTALHFKQELQKHKENTVEEMKRHQYKLLEELQDKIQQAFEVGQKNELIEEVEEKFLVKEKELRRKLKL